MASSTFALRVLAALISLPLCAGLAAADPVVLDPSTFSGAEIVIDFDDLADGEKIFTQYASDGVSFTGDFWGVMGDFSGQRLDEAHASNVEPGDPGSCDSPRSPGCGPFVLDFSPPVRVLGFDFHVANGQSVAAFVEWNGNLDHVIVDGTGFWGIEEREFGIDRVTFQFHQPFAMDNLRLGRSQTCEERSNDADGDGHYTLDSCLEPHDDCDDDNASVHPGQAELCDGVDNDCDGVVPEQLLASKAAGSGKIEGHDGRVSYGFDATRESQGDLRKGKVKYHEHETGLKGKGEVEDLLICEDGSAVVVGSCGEEVGRCRFTVSIEPEEGS